MWKFLANLNWDGLSATDFLTPLWSVWWDSGGRGVALVTPPFFDSRVCLLKAVDGAWVWVLVSLLWGRSTDWCNHYYLKETTWESQNDFSRLNRDVWFECKAANSCVSWFEPVNKTVVSPLGHKKTKQVSARSFRIKTSRPVPYWRRQPSASKLTCAFYIQLYFRHRNWSKDFCWSLKRRKKNGSIDLTN